MDPSLDASSDTHTKPSDRHHAEEKIGLALSGGGFRAAVFHLGVLKRLEEIGLLKRISILSTVSGGSVTGALYALRCAQHGGSPGAYPVEELIAEVKSVVTRNFRRRALFGSPTRAARTLASFVTRYVRRMPLLVQELDRELFDGATLPELPDWILINATNLETGKCWKFFRDRAGDYFIGATDKTDQIRVAEAVGASAAYPVLTDPYPFRGKWEDFRSDLLDERWMRPPSRRPGDISPWRQRYGRLRGNLNIPLVDGGLYDNEGLNGLRSAKVDYAIYASAAPSISAHEAAGWRDLLRVVSVMHSRLGNVTRQHAHEMTHGIDPTKASVRMRAIAEELRDVSGQLDNLGAAQSSTYDDRLSTIADTMDSLARVGWPPRNHQYKSVAPILLRDKSVTRNKAASFDPPYDIPPEYRGLASGLVDELARVRTDLDAFSSEVIGLLVAQAYFLTDAHLKINMPELIHGDKPAARGSLHPIEPFWDDAHESVRWANANEEAVKRLLAEAATSSWLFGRS